MQGLAKGDRVFLVLSDKYLKSPNCMYELMEVWRNCKLEPEALRERIRVYRTTDAAMLRPIERVGYAKYWRDQFRELDAVVHEDPSLLGKADFERFRLIQEFAHHVGDILALIADTLMPKDLDELDKYGFDDGSPTTPPSG